METQRPRQPRLYIIALNPISRMEEQELTAEVVAVKIKKEDDIDKRRKWRGGKGGERGG